MLTAGLAARGVLRSSGGWLGHGQDLFCGEVDVVNLLGVALRCLHVFVFGVFPHGEPQSHLITLVISAPSPIRARGARTSGWLEVDERTWCASISSQVRIEHGQTLLGERDLLGRQGRVALALLVAERDRPVTRDELAEELWLDDPPPTWEKAAMAVVSKLRAALRRAGLGDDALATLDCPGIGTGARIAARVRVRASCHGAPTGLSRRDGRPPPPGPPPRACRPAAIPWGRPRPPWSRSRRGRRWPLP
jgi:DNA-binding winged helix-turn-helix (wHTH) protein